MLPAPCGVAKGCSERGADACRRQEWAFMVWAWALVAVIGIGLPAATWWLTRNLKPPRQAVGGPGPRFARVDHWLYDRYRFGVMDRSRVLNAVLGGQELSDQPHRQAAHCLATAMLAGKVGILYRRAGWMRICSGLGVAGSVLAVAVAQDNYAIMAAAVIGVPQIVMGSMYQKAIRGRVEQAHRLNA